MAESEQVTINKKINLFFIISLYDKLIIHLRFVNIYKVKQLDICLTRKETNMRILEYGNIANPAIMLRNKVVFR